MKTPTLRTASASPAVGTGSPSSLTVRLAWVNNAESPTVYSVVLTGTDLSIDAEDGVYTAWWCPGDDSDDCDELGVFATLEQAMEACEATLSYHERAALMLQREDAI
jgi:hypothetical protein